MQQGLSSCSSFMYFWYGTWKRRKGAECDSSPSRKTDSLRWTNSSNLWRCFQVIMGGNNMGNILQRQLQCFQHFVTLLQWKLFHIVGFKSVRRPLGVWDKVWITHSQSTLFLLDLFFWPCYSCWIFFIGLFLALNIWL